MKIIVSHDVDHFRASEHLLHDLIVPKFLVKTGLERLRGEIASAEVGARLRRLLENRWHNLGEVMDLDESAGIPSTFFVGLRRGLGLSYSLKTARRILTLIDKRGFETGLHGIAYDSPDTMAEERERFFSLEAELPCRGDSRHPSRQGAPGIRMHYLRSSERTPGLLEELGYSYDSSLRGLEAPYRVGGLWEFPVTLMDVDIYRQGGRIRGYEEMKELTLRRFEEARAKEIGYATVIFHDRYFSPEFEALKSWYLWLAELLGRGPYECLSFSEAVGELNG